MVFEMGRVIFSRILTGWDGYGKKTDGDGIEADIKTKRIPSDPPKPIPSPSEHANPSNVRSTHSLARNDIRV